MLFENKNRKFIANCPAKINLFLKVVGKEKNYHQLQSLFAFLDLSDLLEVEVSENFSFEIAGEFASELQDKSNLISQILDYFSEKFSISKNLKIKLTKNIPIGGGLGGGSSNAAYFIKALNEIFSLKLSSKQMTEISLNFGSDIAFLLQNQAALVEKRGEIITPISDFEPLNCLIVNPKINLPTKEVFLALNAEFSEQIIFSQNYFSNNLDKQFLLWEISKFGNDLQKPATKILPEISEILLNLKKQNGCEIAQMSGSGSTCFAIFDDQKNLNSAYENLSQEFPKFFIKKAKIICHV